MFFIPQFYLRLYNMFMTKLTIKNDCTWRKNNKKGIKNVRMFLYRPAEKLSTNSSICRKYYNYLFSPGNPHPFISIVPDSHYFNHRDFYFDNILLINPERFSCYNIAVLILNFNAPVAFPCRYDCFRGPCMP